MLVYDDDQERLWRVLMVVLLFELHSSIRTRHHLHRPTIVSPSNLPWQWLYEQADLLSFLHMTGLTRQCFAMLLSALFDPEEILPHQQHRHGRLQSLRPEGCLGLLLFYLGSTMNPKHLCTIFGIVPGICSKVVRASEAAPCPLQPCYFDKWDLFADTRDCQYAMGFPVCIFMYLGVSLHNFIPIFPIS